MAITIEDVRYVAQLAQLELDDDALIDMTTELASILEHIGRIGELDLDGVQPTSNALELLNVVAADTPRPSLSNEQALANAPDARDGAFAVPQMRS